MQNRAVYIDAIGPVVRRLVVEDGKPAELAVLIAHERQCVGNLYLATVVSIHKGMHAAFVDIGMDKNAFLSLDDMPRAAKDASGIAPRREKAAPLKCGQEIIVQVIKDAGGDKGPRVSMNPTIAGRYVVLLPTMTGIGISKHIDDAQRRRQLQCIGEQVAPQGMGLILRTAADDAPQDAITQEVETLRAQWDAIAQAARTLKAPHLLLDETDLAGGAVRDLGMEPIYGPFDEVLEAKLEKELRRKVWLGSGAYLLFDHTEALTVIDINSGKFVGGKNLDDTLLRLNTEAAREIARLLRLRDIGGIVLIDFVDMRKEADREAVLSAFVRTMQSDRAKYHIHGFTNAGLLELTRRPLYRPVMQALRSTCSRCHGEGTVERAICRAARMLREVERKRDAGDRSEITLTVSADIMRALEAIGIPDAVTLRMEGEER